MTIEIIVLFTEDWSQSVKSPQGKEPIADQNLLEYLGIQNTNF